MLPGALRVPIVQAPLAGGASTPALTAAVGRAGAFGFVAAGYKTPDALRDDIRATRALADEPFGVNVFVPGRATAPPRYQRYLEALRDEAGRQGVALGEPRFEDDAWDAKLALLEEDPVAAVSFTFGCPPPDVVARLQGAGSSVWVTVTDVEEAQGAALLPGAGDLGSGSMTKGELVVICATNPPIVGATSANAPRPATSASPIAESFRSMPLAVQQPERRRTRPGALLRAERLGRALAVTPAPASTTGPTSMQRRLESQASRRGEGAPHAPWRRPVHAAVALLP